MKNETHKLDVIQQNALIQFHWIFPLCGTIFAAVSKTATNKYIE